MLRSLTRAVLVVALALIPFTMPHCGGGGGGNGEEPISGEFCVVLFTEHVGYYLSMPPNGEFLIGAGTCRGSVKPVDGATTGVGITGATPEPYPATGMSVAEVWSNITGGSARNGYAGSTELEVSGSFTQTGTAENGNLLIHIDSVTWTVYVALPDWAPPEGTPPTEIAIWTEIYAELVKHEQGHVDRMNNGMPAARDQAVCQTVEVPPGSTEQQIGDAIRTRVESTAAYGAMAQSNSDYDAPYDATTNPTGTNHGTQNGQAAYYNG